MKCKIRYASEKEGKTKENKERHSKARQDDNNNNKKREKKQEKTKTGQDKIFFFKYCG